MNKGRKSRTPKYFCFLSLSLACSTMSRKPTETLRLIVTTFVGIIFGFLLGVSVSLFSVSKINPAYLPASILPIITQQSGVVPRQNAIAKNASSVTSTQIYVQHNPKGAEMLPPGIVVSESDFYLHRLWGLPSEDLKVKPKYLMTFTVGYDLRHNIDAAVKKLSDNFTIVLFHYDGRMSEWNEFEWSNKAIHISTLKQTKWWYAKRFLHPDIVAPYDYIFIWDEDLGVEHFNAEKYIDLVKKHGLEISQPGIECDKGYTWQMTKRQVDVEVHKQINGTDGQCYDPNQPPCAAFIEIMAPVFSRDAWRCVWHMIQNDLVHGWGLDFALRKCVKNAHETIGVVDAQWVIHQRIPSLGNQGDQNMTDGNSPWKSVRIRCEREWKMFNSRLDNAEKARANMTLTESSQSN